ncbi:uncharacterized protein LOC135375699 isoform X1 [Ornithodoros turicata]|uniref:uncharacterized protein LOC135375699 isoform X1 n=1 Tax=Ornithodoros turicata TaxID=34597 RepID=UPI0031391D43
MKEFPHNYFGSELLVWRTNGKMRRCARSKVFSSSPTFFQNAPESPPPISYTPVPGPTPEYHWSPPPQHYWGLPPQHCQCCVQRELSCGKQCVVVKVFRLGFSPSPDWHHNWHNSQHNWLQ